MHRIAPATFVAGSILCLVGVPAQAITCGSVTVTGFTISCTVLEDTRNKFHVRALSTGDTILPELVTGNFSYSGNWESRFLVQISTGGFAGRAQGFASGDVRHLNAPHGEGPGPSFFYTTGIVEEGGLVSRRFGREDHGTHFDRFQAMAFYNKDRFQFDLFASHVPEPESWMMMVLGFGAIGIAIRQRGAKAIAA